MMGKESFATRWRCAKLCGAAACCLCAMVAVGAAGCGKGPEPGRIDMAEPSGDAGVTGSAEPTGSNAPEGDPEPTDAADKDAPGGGEPGQSGEDPEDGADTENYAEHEVSVGGGEYPLEGILTLPDGVEQPPVVLLVHGSGQSDKDETVGAAGNAPFADIAHGLAGRGIATLRYDKRYYEYPELAADTVTIWDEVLNDVAAAVALLSEMPQVDGGRIFVLGHSLGGMLAPCIVQENPQVAGMISMAGSPRGLWDIVYDQNIAAMQAAELSESEFSVLEEMLRQEYERVLSLVADVRDAQSEPEEEELSEALFGVSGHYWASLAKIDTAAIVQELSVPMLILQGDADFQVYPERDFAAWKMLLEGKENVTFRLFEGLNHLFMPSNGAMDITEYDEEAHVSQEVIDTIAEWLFAPRE